MFFFITVLVVYPRYPSYLLSPLSLSSVLGRGYHIRYPFYYLELFYCRLEIVLRKPRESAWLLAESMYVAQVWRPACRKAVNAEHLSDGSDVQVRRPLLVRNRQLAASSGPQQAVIAGNTFGIATAVH
jgi:hypothetical protein